MARTARTLAGFFCLTLAFGWCVAVDADNIVINNGLAPPEPTNVINHTTFDADSVYVRNVGCPPGWPSGNAWDPCSPPGAATAVELTDGGYVGGFRAFDTSIITMSGGIAGDVKGQDSAAVFVTGGHIWVEVTLWDSATGLISGGSNSPVNLIAMDSSRLTVLGSVFQIDGNPVPYGDVTVQSGSLTGILASGEPIDTVFFQGGYDLGMGMIPDMIASGTITLIPEPSTALLVACGLVGLAVGRRKIRPPPAPADRAPRP